MMSTNLAISRFYVVNLNLKLLAISYTTLRTTIIIIILATTKVVGAPDIVDAAILSTAQYTPY